MVQVIVSFEKVEGLRNFFALLSFFFLFLAIEFEKLKTFRIHPPIRLKYFHRRVHLKAIQKCDFILCYHQELHESVHAFIQNSVSVCS